jgi:hypothetical protein
MWVLTAFIQSSMTISTSVVVVVVVDGVIVIITTSLFLLWKQDLAHVLN